MRARLFCLAAVGLGGCAPAPRYQPPPQPVPVAWRDTAATREASTAEPPWWTIYRDTALRRLVRTALAQNTNLRVAVERIAEARDLLRAARGAQLPSILASATAARSWYDVLGAPADGWSAYQAVGANASWDVDLFGYRRSYASMTRAQLQEQEEFGRAVRLGIVADVASVYVGLQESDRRLDILESATEARRGYLDATRRRFEANPSAELDYRQAQALVESASELAIDERQIVSASENALSVLLGSAPGPIARRGAPGESLLPEIPVGLPSTLVQRRPDVRAAERELAAAGANVGAARAQLFPRLLLSASIGYDNSRSQSTYAGFASRSRSENTTETVSASLSQPIFVGGQYVAQLGVAQARRREALAAYEGVVLRALQEAEDALASTRFARERRVSLDSQVAYTAAALRAAEARYGDGTSPFLELRDAHERLLSAQLGAVSARAGEALAVIAVYRALGGGWQAEPTAADRPDGR